MTTRTPIGARVRERRKAAGLTQIALAERLGVSASYLNLIEHDRRRIGGALLSKLAAELDAPIEAFDGAADRGLAHELSAIVAEPMLAELGLATEDVSELVARRPNWAHAVRSLHRAYQERDRAARALADRLNHDPELSAAVHQLLTKASAVRSSAQILELGGDLDAVEAARFRTIVASESEELAGVAKQLAAFFDLSNAQLANRGPSEEVDDFLFERGDYFPVIEEAAEAFVAASKMVRDRWKSRLLDHLTDRFDVAAVSLEPDHAVLRGARRSSAYDPARREIVISARASEATRRFELGRWAARFAFSDAIEAELATARALTGEPARALARDVLASYAAAALMMPYDACAEDAAALRFDVEALARRYQASFEQAAHRLVTLRRPGTEAPAFAFMRVDPAGFVTKRFPLPNLALPRHGGACPLWTVYRSFRHPERVARDLVEFPDGERFLMIAKSVSKPALRYDAPPRIHSVMLAVDALHADRLVYGDGLALDARAAPLKIGPSCALCVRRACDHRQEATMVSDGDAAATMADLGASDGRGDIGALEDEQTAVDRRE